MRQRKVWGEGSLGHFTPNDGVFYRQKVLLTALPGGMGCPVFSFKWLCIYWVKLSLICMEKKMILKALILILG